MRYVLFFFAVLFAFSAYGFEFPEKVPLKSATRSFNHQFDVSIIDGRIWYRQKSAEGNNSDAWKLLGKTGLPEGSSSYLPGLNSFDSPSSVAELSTDGDNLIAIGNNNIVYYMKWSTRQWTDKWGKPFSRKLRLPEKIRSWSISHRGPLAGGYHDIDGNFHPISVGVTSLYILEEDGLTIRYADPWLPADFSHEICGPLRNRFRARTLDASASTLFVINDSGEMFTRLADFDTLGHNRFLEYSYERKKGKPSKEKDVRKLPPEDWKRQPSIPENQGQVSSSISILQTGKGNDSRELRVEGVIAQGVHGFFSKKIHEEAWNFTRTDLPLQKPLLHQAGGLSDLGHDWDQTFSGHLLIGNPFKKEKYEAKINNFNPVCSGAHLVIKIGNDDVEFPFYTTTSSRDVQKMDGAITMTDEIKAKALNNKLLQAFINKMFGKESFIKIRLHISEDGTVTVRKHSLFPVMSIKLKKEI